MGGGDLVNAPGPLIGRADDLEYLTAFVDQATVSGRALLLSGRSRKVARQTAARSPHPPAGQLPAAAVGDPFF